MKQEHTPKRGRLRLVSIPDGCRVFGPSRLFRYLTWVSFLLGTLFFGLAVSAWRSPDSYGWLGFDAVSIMFGVLAGYHWVRSIYFFANGPDRMLIEIKTTLIKLGRWKTFARDRVQAVLVDDFGEIASMLGFRIDGREMFLGELTAVEDVGDIANRLAELLEVPVQRRQQVR